MNETIDKEELLCIERITKKRPVSRSISKVDIHDLKTLFSFKYHSFSLYEGQRFMDMVESVCVKGVIVPIVVCPETEERKYEILLSHNRVEVA